METAREWWLSGFVLGFMLGAVIVAFLPASWTPR
jgi:hypothetical protein